MGARRLKAGMETAPLGAEGIGAGGHSLSLYALDSRFRGNDKRGCRDSSLLRVWGYPPTQFPPKSGGQGVESNGLSRTPRKHDTYAMVLSVPRWASQILCETDGVVPSQLRIAVAK